MYHILEEQVYECGECGGKGKKFQDSPKDKFSGHDEGIRCIKCGHETRWYVKSIYEQMSGSGNTYSYNPREPRKF